MEFIANEGKKVEIEVKVFKTCNQNTICKSRR